ncbi:MAG: type II toxin-antitoxin system VapB family antitoxin [bacterium]
MRTTRDMSDSLLQEAFSVSKARTKKDLIHEALREYIRLKRRKDLTELAGSIEFCQGYDHREMRNICRDKGRVD